MTTTDPDLLLAVRRMEEFMRDREDLVAAIDATDPSDPTAMANLHVTVSEHLLRAKERRNAARGAQDHRAMFIAAQNHRQNNAVPFAGTVLPASAHTFWFRVGEKLIDVIIVEGMYRHRDEPLEPYVEIVVADAHDATGWRRIQRGSLSSIAGDIDRSGRSIRTSEVLDAHAAFARGDSKSLVRILNEWWDAVQREQVMEWVHVSTLGRPLGPT